MSSPVATKECNKLWTRSVVKVHVILKSQERQETHMSKHPPDPEVLVVMCQLLFYLELKWKCSVLGQKEKHFCRELLFKKNT